MAAYRLPPGEEAPRRSLDELAREVEETVRLQHQVDLAGLGMTLPGLLEELRATTHILSGSARERTFWLLGDVYCATWQVVYPARIFRAPCLRTFRCEEGYAAVVAVRAQMADARMAASAEAVSVTSTAPGS
jgi:hypothetical protein